MVKVKNVCLLTLEVDLGSVLGSELGQKLRYIYIYIWCVKGMFVLNVVLSETIE